MVAYCRACGRYILSVRRLSSGVVVSVVYAVITDQLLERRSTEPDCHVFFWLEQVIFCRRVATVLRRYTVSCVGTYNFYKRSSFDLD